MLRLSSTVLPTLTRFTPFTLATRSFATAKRQPDVFGAAGKAALEYFEEAKESNKLREALDQLRIFRTNYESSSDLRTLFINPLLNPEQRAEELSTVLPELGITNELTIRFINDLATNKLLSKIKQVVNDMERLVSFELNERYATVTSAEPLTPAQVERITRALQGKIEKGENLMVNTVVDPSILGGLVVALDDKILDASAASQIRQLDALIREQQ